MVVNEFIWDCARSKLRFSTVVRGMFKPKVRVRVMFKAKVRVSLAKP